MLTVSVLAAAILMMSPTAQGGEAPPRATVQQGVLAGHDAEGVVSFKGVPYARPPVGELRWRPPQPAAAWTGERDATRVGAICIQPPANGDNGVGPLPMSEDCLTLNVWAPVERDGPLPVMFWIHGGGLNNGSGTAALYDGTRLAKRAVVVVTINYRLGRLGFFDHPALAAERDADEPAANYGLMDVVAALRWVRDNAAAFGGDPDNVTIFGESAGGALVTRLMISPEARGLFHRAVVQSGLGRDEGTPLDAPRRNGGPSMQARGEAFAATHGATTAEDLRAIPAETFLQPAPNFYGGDLLVRDGSGPVTFRRAAEMERRGWQRVEDGYGRPFWITDEIIFSDADVIEAVLGDDPEVPSLSVKLSDAAALRLAEATRSVPGDRYVYMIGDAVVADARFHSSAQSGELRLQGGGDAAPRLLSAINRRAAASLIYEDVEAAFAGGREAPVPLIIGTNSAEFWWMKPSDLTPYGAIDDAMTDQERAASLAAYGGQEGYDQFVLSDLVFNEPARRLARLHARNGHPTYLYRFDVVSAAMPEPHEGATHASERQYVFDNLTASPWPTAEMDQRQADQMAGYWTTFAAKGDPNGGGRQAWPEFGAEPDRLLEFTNEGPVAKPVPFAERLDLIEAYYARVR